MTWKALAPCSRRFVHLAASGILPIGCVESWVRMSARPPGGTCPALVHSSLLCQSTTVCSSKRWICRGCGCRNLCHQAIFINHASCAVTPLYPEMGQAGDAVGQRAERRGLVQVRCGRCVV